MRQPRSIRFHLSAVFFFFFLLVIILGLFSITRLSDFNGVSASIIELWLPNTRVLGDLNNFTSDFRAAEGSNLLSSSPSEVAATERETEQLDRSIAQAQRNYERLRHDAVETRLYDEFRRRWEEYRSEVNQVLALSRAGRKSEAVTMYLTASRAAYDAASDSLAQLTKRTVAQAEEASGRVGAVYRQAYWLIGLAMLIAGVMIVGALLYIRRSISGPLLHLAGCMHRLADNDTAIDIEGTERRDEIGEMARATVVFRNNAIELMMSQRGLMQQATMLEEKLAQERRLTQLQHNFVSMASHEFRTPLTVIDGHAQRLAKMSAQLRPADIVERAGKIRSAVLRVTNLIDDLLTAARLVESGAELYFHPTEVNVSALLHEVCQLHREMLPRSQITEDFGTEPLVIFGDPKLLSQAFGNLLSNAIKYSPRGGPVRVSAHRDAQQVAITVEDSGIGIPAADIDRLFVRYFRGSNVSGIVGTGVGLYLVKLVVDLHGGEVGVTSRLGEGSRFTVRLPIKPAVAHEATLAPALPERAAYDKSAEDHPA
jgi:two-component system OmpR family sensor kinase